MAKTLSVVIPSYNVEKYLPEILPTFLSPEVLDDIEVLIVNDGSKDNTSKVGKEFQDKYPNTVRIIDKENGGHGSTINRGIEEAVGKYFKVVDGDDWVDTDVFIKYVNALKTLEADAVMTPFNRVNEDTGLVEPKTFTGIDYNKEYKFEEIICQLGEEYQMHSATFKTEILKKIRKIDEHCFYVDQEYICYPFAYLNTMVFLPYAIYQYRVGNNEQSVSVASKQRNRAMHERVIFSIMDYWMHTEFSPNKKKFLETRICNMCARQYEIWVSMDCTPEVKKEMNAFAAKVKETNSEVFKKIPGKKQKLLKMSGNKLLPLIKKIMK